MNNILTINSLRFVFLIALQVLLLKNIGVYNLATPFPYILFVLLLPLGMPNLLLFILSFAAGFMVDVFYDTLGVHAAACTFLAFMRIVFINLTVQLENHESFATPSLSEMNFKWFFIYVTVITFLHHLVLLFLESFSFFNVFYTLISVVLSCIFTVILIFVLSLVFYRKKKH